MVLTRTTLGCCLAALMLAFVGPADRSDAATFDQLEDPFNFTNVNGEFAVDSQFDVGAPAPFREDFTIAYDNFSFGSTLTLTTIDFIGLYADADFLDRPLATSFDLAIFASDPVNGGPLTNNGAVSPGTTDVLPGGSPLFTQNFLNDDLGPISTGGTGFFYTADISGAGFVADAGTEYFLSIVANLSNDDNGFGIAFSDTVVGDDQSFQDFGEFTADPVERFINGGDLAIRITAVPEPSSLLAIAVIGGLAGYRRRRRPSVALKA